MYKESGRWLRDQQDLHKKMANAKLIELSEF